MGFNARLKHYQEVVHQGILKQLATQENAPEPLRSALHYSLFARGKRLRPVLLIASHALSPSKEDPMPAAVAVECVHTYSLIHDDLPCMDDSDFRRGQPSCHKKFDEATAVLAGDALLTYAFEILAREYGHRPKLAIQLVQDLSFAAGSLKLIGGQVQDLQNEDHLSQNLKAEDFELFYSKKTGALLQTSIAIGLKIAGQPESKIQLGMALGHCIGVAFQLVDDILDITSNKETLGKPSGIDEDNKKGTYPAVLGIEQAEKRVRQLTEEALELCQQFEGDTEFFTDLIEYLQNRIH